MIVCLNFANGVERFTRPYFIDDESVKEEAEQGRLLTDARNDTNGFTKSATL